MASTDGISLDLYGGMNVPLLLCILTYAPGLILNSTFLLCVKSPRKALNAADLTIFLKTLQYIVVYSLLLVMEGIIWSKEILNQRGERILKGISDALVDTLPITTFVLAIIRVMIFSNFGSSIRKVKNSTNLALYGSCLLYVIICSVLIHVPLNGNELESQAMATNSSQYIHHISAHYFTAIITPFIGSLMLYSSIILKMREFASTLVSQQERLTVQTSSNVSAIRAVTRSMIGYLIQFLLLWVPYVTCKLIQSSVGNAYVVEIIEKAITGSILISNPIADGMYQASRRKCLLQYIRNSSHQVECTNEVNSQQQIHTNRQTHGRTIGGVSKSSFTSDNATQPLYARRRGNDDSMPHISIISTPDQLIMMTTTPQSENLHLSPKDSIELLSPVFYRSKNDTPPRSTSFHTVQSNDCLIESISFRSSLLSVDQGPYSSTPGSMHAASSQSNKRISIIRCTRSSASIGNRYKCSSATTCSHPGTSFSSQRSRGDICSMKRNKYDLDMT